MSDWISVDTELPKPHQKVIAYYKNCLGKDRRIMAEYVHRFTVESNSEYDFVYEWDETEETAYLVEGWVELIDNWDEYTSIYLDTDNKPTHWMPLPEPPK